MDKQTQKNLLDLVKLNYEEIAEDFDNTRKKYLWPELIKLAGMVKDGDKVMDVGCGNGRLVEAFRNKKINYLGVDNSGKLIEAARKNFLAVIADMSKITPYLSSSGERQRDPGIQKGEAQINLDSRFRGNDKEKNGNDKEEMVARNDSGRYEFQVADILELDKIPENNFDYIFCIAVLHHLPGRDLRLKALEQMKNKLKPGGKIIITVWNLWSREKFKSLILKCALLKIIGKNKMDFGDILFNWKNNKGEKISRRYYHAFTKNKLKKLAIRAGLKIEKLYKDKYNYYLILEK